MVNNCQSRDCFKQGGEHPCATDTEADNIHAAHVHVFSDSVLCLGGEAQSGACGEWKLKADAFLSQIWCVRTANRIHVARLPRRHQEVFNNSSMKRGTVRGIIFPTASYSSACSTVLNWSEQVSSRCVPTTLDKLQIAPRISSHVVGATLGPDPCSLGTTTRSDTLEEGGT